MSKKLITLRGRGSEVTFVDVDHITHCSRHIDDEGKPYCKVTWEVGKTYFHSTVTEESFRGLLNCVEVLNNG